MNPTQLRETTIDPRTRRLVQLTIDAVDTRTSLMDMLLAKKRASTGATGSKRRGTSPRYRPNACRNRNSTSKASSASR